MTKTKLRTYATGALWALAAIGLVAHGVVEALTAFAADAPTDAARHLATTAASWLGALGALARNLGALDLAPIFGKPTRNDLERENVRLKAESLRPGPLT